MLVTRRLVAQQMTDQQSSVTDIEEAVAALPALQSAYQDRYPVVIEAQMAIALAQWRQGVSAEEAKAQQCPNIKSLLNYQRESGLTNDRVETFARQLNSFTVGCP